LWCTCIGLLFQVGDIRRHASRVILMVQYISVMCVIQCCSLCLVQALDIPSSVLMSHHHTRQHHSEKIALLAVWGASQNFPKFLGRSLTTYQISVHLHSLQSNPLLLWYSNPSRISMIGSTAESNFTTVSSSHPVICSGYLHCCHNVSPWA
jgi:hypothetical protein